MKKTLLAAATLFLSSLAFAQLPGSFLDAPQCHEQAKPSQDPWATPTEATGYCKTPRYDETFAYIHRIAQAAPTQVKLETFGQTGEGRDLIAVIVSKDGVFDPAKLHAQNRPIVMVQNAIHAGEMDGKDACLALMRDILVKKTKAALIDRAALVIIPIYNADGHERFSAFNRINQNGPVEMGWRTNASNLNLNRDYMKADAPETRSLLRLWNEWLPDFFVDDHVTDGADYQFDSTYTADSGPDVDPGLRQWVDGSLRPYIKQQVDASGHLLAPYIWLADDTDPTKGFTGSQDTPRFSTGYMILQNRPGFLVEMHMLKNYETRVTGNYEMLRVLLELINRDADKLTAINRAADATTVASGSHCASVSEASNPSCTVLLKLAPTGKTDPFLYRGYKFTREHSDVSGGTWVRYSHDPMDVTIPRENELKIVKSVTIPRAYILPPQWTAAIGVLQAHGIKLIRTTKPVETEAEIYRCERPTWSEQPFEGHHLASFKSPNPCALTREKVSYPPNSVIVPLDQRAAKIAVHLLEPEGVDSLLTWGFFDTIFEQKEYGEGYVVEKLAREMIAKDPKLKAEFDAKVASDKAFAASPEARLNWFYQRSPWWDSQIGRYPVGRLLTCDAVGGCIQ